MTLNSSQEIVDHFRGPEEVSSIKLSVSLNNLSRDTFKPDMENLMIPEL